MSISDAQYQAWLERDGERRCILVEIDYYNIGGAATGTLYASTLGYISHAADTPAHTAYDDIVLAVPPYSAKLRLPDPQRGDLGIRSEISWGEIEISNESGARDAWRDYAFAGRGVRLYRGAPEWAKADFRLVFAAVCTGLRTGADSLVFGLRGREDALDTPMQTNVLASGPAVGHKIPLALGECYNAAPVCTNVSTHEYQVHDGAISAFTQVRDNGAAVAITGTISTGKFTRAAQAVGNLTADLAGDNSGGTYRTKAGALSRYVAETYAGMATADIDTAAFSALDTACPQVLGLYVRDGGNALTAIDELLSSVGAFWYMTRAGQLSAARFTAPAVSAVLSIGADDIAERSFRVERETAPVWKVEVGYKRNWFPQDADSLAGSLGEQARFEYAQEFRYAESSDSGVLTAWPQANAVRLDTLLQDGTDAATEAARLLALWKVRRAVYSLTATLTPGTVELGDTVSLTHPRYGFSAGANVVVVGIEELPARNKIKLWVWK